MHYPVEAVLDGLLRGLAGASNAVLIAPPGAGKTTIVAPALLQQNWCKGQILLISPRRIAARMTAERIAQLAGQAVGGRIGYATRMDSKQSSATRLLVLTEGVFRNRIIADPELAGVSAVLFDEVHERSLNGDFGLALALEAQAAFRPDLRLVAMSATLDGNRFAALMGDALLIQSEGKSFPLELIYVGRRAELPIEQDIAHHVRLALRNRSGDILVFLPGSREIERAVVLLADLAEDIALHRLYGTLDPDAQRAAVQPDVGGRRKVILATNIAETSLTIDGVRMVIDSGLARRARYDKAAGVVRLVTERSSLSAATQRAGRAARQAPGVAYRLWEEAGNGGLPPFDPPEILESDLAGLTLDCAVWGESDPARLRWLDPPPAASLAEARRTLLSLNAIDADGRITAHGNALAKMPLPPHLAHMLIMAGKQGQARRAAIIALLMQERGLGGTSEDIELRLDRFEQERGGRTQAARRLAARLAQMAESGFGAPLTVGAIVALAFPNRIAKRRDSKGESWISVIGRGLRLEPGSPFANAEWLAVADVQGAASGARIVSAARLDEREIESIFAGRIETTSSHRYDRENDRVEAKAIRKLGAIKLAESRLSIIPAAAAAEILCRAVAEYGLDALPWPTDAIALRKRATFAGNDAISDEALLASLDIWLAPIVMAESTLGHEAIRRLRDIRGQALLTSLEATLGWEGLRQIAKIAPPGFTSPAGTMHPIDYAAPAGPTVVLRVQALFGLDEHPVVGSHRVPLVLSLTSPAGRPIQTTRDLASFWRGSWADVAKEMRGRYPKHNWPDAPWEATASLKTKRAQAKNCKR